MACGDPIFLEETSTPAYPEPNTQAMIDYMLGLRDRVKECNADKRAFLDMMQKQTNSLKEEAPNP